MKDIFEFNQIDKTLSESDIKTRCNKWRWGARCKYFKNEELQEENGNDANCIYNI